MKPRICVYPDAVFSRGQEVIDLYEQATGQILDAEQRFVIMNSCGVTKAGKWAAFEVAVAEARQNGKNEITIARQLGGLFLFKSRLLIHSAHEFKTSTEHQRRLEEIIQSNPDLHKRVKPRGYRHSHGEESIELRTGQRIRFMTRTKGGGRGHTGDEVDLDEAMILPDAMMGALMPTLSARSVQGNPQLRYAFTAVDQTIHDHGVVAARLRERALAGDDPSLAYFEWSAHVGDPAEDNPEKVTPAQAQDHALWAQANPAFGVRISAEHIANEQRSMAARTFAVERLGVGDWPPTSLEAQQVIPLDQWRALTDATKGRCELQDPVCIAFDVSPDRSSAAIATSSTRADGMLGVEIIDHRRGTAWVPDRIVELVNRHRPVAVVFDAAGPASSLQPEIVYAGVEVTPYSARDLAAGCGLFVDAVTEGALRHLGTTELETALQGAMRREIGDSWKWSRRHSTVDISPLVAATLALYGFQSREIPAPPPMVAFG